MDDELTLNLAVIEESRSDAEALANILRDGGLKNRLTYVAGKSDFAKLVDEGAPDLILHAASDRLTLQDVCGTLARQGIDTPVIAVAENCDEPAVIAALRAGACDLCSYDQPDHLQLIARRETGRLLLSRKVQSLQDLLDETEKRTQLLMESSRDAIAYVHQGTHIFANKTYLDMFGFDSKDDIEGTPLMDMVAPDDHDRFKEFLRSYDAGGSTDSEFRTRGVLVDGNQFEAVLEFTRARISGELCTQIIIRNDSADSKELELKIQNLTRQDMVTGLYNRQYFLQELELACKYAAKNGTTGALLYLLIDNFKDIKDSVGIGIADRIIADVADILKADCAAGDIVSRFGDHSFAVLRADCDETSIKSLGDALRRHLEDHVADIENHSVTTTCSIGMSLVSEATTLAQDVLTRADLACEVARSSGGNQIYLHNPVVDEKLGKERNEQIHELIREALDRDLFRLMFQPIVSLQGDTRENYEVLLRMVGTDSELILPAQFLSVAANTGQISDIDRWVIKNAFRTLAARRNDDHDTRFFLKIAPGTLVDERLAEFVIGCLREVKLLGEAIVFEIPEQAGTLHLNQAKYFIKQLTEYGCGTALEHFGNSPNSFQLLKHLPVDYLKIDGSFIHNLATSSENQAAVRNILETARGMKIQCVAEFVEDPHSLAVLWQNGIDYIQGNFLQEPSGRLEYDFTSEIA